MTAVLAAATACEPQQPPQTPETAAAPTPIPPAPASAAAPQPEPPTQVLPPEPVPVRFQAWDGQELEGTFYPPAEVPSPVVVLMHWIRSDESDWSAVARWLQNRLAPSGPASPGLPWLDPSWFHDTGSKRGYAVLTFTFRGCQGGCRGFDPQGWLIDARSVLQVAAGQPGVDPMRLLAIGASIGGDEAIDACAWLSSEQGVARCVGALPAHPVALCLASEGDEDSAQACASAEGANYRSILYAGSAHGMELVAPGRVPDVLSTIADFLTESVGS